MGISREMTDRERILLLVGSAYLPIGQRHWVVGANTDTVSVGQGLKDFSVPALSKGFQIDEANPLVGSSARVEILQRLGASLLGNEDVFGPQGRPGGIVGTYPHQ